MKSTLENTFVEVIETQRVKYKKNRILFFEWESRVSAESIGKDLHILSNDIIRNVYFNGEKIK